jgi:hypothetical protein
MIKKIKSIYKLISPFIKRPEKLVLSFTATSSYGLKRWYYDFKDWPWDHDRLEMVAGADTLCNHYSADGFHTKVDVLATSSSPSLAAIGYDIYERQPLAGNLFTRALYGATYVSRTMSKKTAYTFWICPVTLFVFGRYPKYLAIKKV